MTAVHAIAAHPTAARARRILRATDRQTVADQLALAAIPAPPFAETERARAVRDRLHALGVDDLALDEAGNVLARLPGPATGAPVILAAHLDTVFPAGTPIAVRHERGRWLAPGIADNARGLAAILALARALIGARATTRAPLVLAATVGEEGPGDLRGVRHLFRAGSPWRDAAAFIAIDGAGCRRIVHRAVGARRLRVTITGPGGHPWGDPGTANPIHALSAALAELAHTPLPARPRTTLATTRIGGGTGINVLPAEAWAELDLRSEDGPTLLALEAAVRERVHAATASANAHRRSATPPLTATIELIGDRPTGATPPHAPLCRAARAATRAIGETPELAASSTDANIPIALGIPAIALGAGGRAGGIHTLHEWYTNERGVEGLERILLTALAAAGLER